MGYDETSFEHESGYSTTVWIDNDNITVQLERDIQYSVVWSTDLEAAGFMDLVAHLPEVGDADAVAYTWSTKKNFETSGSELLREWAGLGPDEFSRDYAFVRIDLPSFCLAWQIVPVKNQRWEGLPPPEDLRHSVLGLIGDYDVDPPGVTWLMQSTCTKKLHEYLAQQHLNSQLEQLERYFKHGDWSAFLGQYR
jgi:hypothetical protein